MCWKGWGHLGVLERMGTLRCVGKVVNTEVCLGRVCLEGRKH